MGGDPGVVRGEWLRAVIAFSPMEWHKAISMSVGGHLAVEKIPNTRLQGFFLGPRVWGSGMQRMREQEWSGKLLVLRQSGGSVFKVLSSLQREALAQAAEKDLCPRAQIKRPGGEGARAQNTNVCKSMHEWSEGCESLMRLSSKPAGCLLCPRAGAGRTAFPSEGCQVQNCCHSLSMGRPGKSHIGFEPGTGHPIHQKP